MSWAIEELLEKIHAKQVAKGTDKATADLHRPYHRAVIEELEKKYTAIYQSVDLRGMGGSGVVLEISRMENTSGDAIEIKKCIK